MPEPTAEQVPTAEEERLSPAELKKRAKAEKQARRAAQKEGQAVTEGTNSGQPQAQGASTNAVTGIERQSRSSAPVRQADRLGRGQPQGEQRRAEGSGAVASTAQSNGLPLRPKQGQTAPVKEHPAKRKQEEKRVDLFSHLYVTPRRHGLEGVHKDVHPAVMAIGLQMSNYEICGSSARCVAMLLAFKEAIQAYTTPAGTSLARHLTSHYLSPQIEYLRSCRPISESMGNAIRFLKKKIVEVDPGTDDQSAKDQLCEDIDTFVNERIIITDQAIAQTASKQIKPGSVVLTFARSSLVEKTILQAAKNGVQFRIIVADSRPLFEGKAFARSLMRRGLQVEYVPFSGIAHAVKQASVVLLGAHSMLSNGRLQSRIGTATIAMLATKADVPVIVCCGSIKFSGKVALDSIVQNEIAPSEELLFLNQSDQPGSLDIDEDALQESKQKTIRDWKDIPNLQILNLMYDVTPAEYIRMIICEYGSLPSTSVPVVHRMANEGD